MPDNIGERLADGEGFAHAIHDYLLSDSPNIISERSGLELTGLSAVLRDIRRSRNAMERRLRFNPDGRLFLSEHGLSHWEAKASIYIERAPYEWYMKYENNGEPVLLFICPGLRDEPLGTWRPVWVGRVRDITLEHGDDTDDQWEYLGRKPRRPVDGEGWITDSAKGSGTPFRKINRTRSKMVRLTSAALDAHGSRDAPAKCRIDYDFLISDTVGRKL